MSPAESRPELVSVKNFLRQARVELEHEMRSELGVGSNRELRHELRASIDAALDNWQDGNLAAGLEQVRAQVRAAVLPLAEEVKRRAEEKSEERQFQRINLSVRLQHGIMALSVVALIFTGLPLKFPDIPFFVWVMHFLGGIDNSTYIHRVAACGLIAVSLWHLVYIIFFREGRRDFFRMLPNFKDVKDFTQMMRFYFGRSADKPKFARFSYVEKFDYWAVYWGCIIMIGTGALLWSTAVTFAWFPKYVYDIAKEVHSDEALLATLAIVIWHFYNVHFNPSRFPGSMVWYHGKLTEEQMRDEHPLELEEILAREAAEERKAAGEGES
jgi:cytochrome b subunit of formate dehydrogenase